MLRKHLISSMHLTAFVIGRPASKLILFIAITTMPACSQYLFHRRLLIERLCSHDNEAASLHCRSYDFQNIIFSLWIFTLWTVVVKQITFISWEIPVFFLGIHHKNIKSHEIFVSCGICQVYVQYTKHLILFYFIYFVSVDHCTWYRTSQNLILAN
jgi:hypothetical protein